MQQRRYATCGSLVCGRVSLNRQRRLFGLPRKCIFCGHGGEPGNPMTGEHLWSEWMHPYLPKLEEPTKEEFYQVIRGIGPVNIEKRKPQQGHTYSKKIKAVCKRCNNGWMGGIETAVKPILIDLLEGRLLSLDRIMQRRLVTWITLKMLVAENQNVADRVVQQDGLSFFKAFRTIPRGTKIWIAYHDTPEWYAGYGGQTLQASLTREPPMFRGRKNIQASGFGIGHLFVLIYFTTLHGFDPELDQIEQWGFVRRLWPLRPMPVTWPMRMVSDTGIAHLSHLVEHIIRAPFSEWRA
jgi:hypothetical protein